MIEVYPVERVALAQSKLSLKSFASFDNITSTYRSIDTLSWLNGYANSNAAQVVHPEWPVIPDNTLAS